MHPVKRVHFFVSATVTHMVCLATAACGGAQSLRVNQQCSQSCRSDGRPVICDSFMAWHKQDYQCALLTHYPHLLNYLECEVDLVLHIEAKDRERPCQWIWRDERIGHVRRDLGVAQRRRNGNGDYTSKNHESNDGSERAEETLRELLHSNVLLRATYARKVPLGQLGATSLLSTNNRMAKAMDSAEVLSIFDRDCSKAGETPNDYFLVSTLTFLDIHCNMSL